MWGFVAPERGGGPDSCAFWKGMSWSKLEKGREKQESRGGNKSKECARTQVFLLSPFIP